ncbi:hypothetical protein X773_17190 [Mesorhizobium sp. LSJC285A00]|nr:hypothetical protein X773_17190 [Mesorhizobium sp. LSJC285A00]
MVLYLNRFHLITFGQATEHMRNEGACAIVE